MLLNQWSGIQKEISSSKKAGCCKQSTPHPTAYQKRFYFPKTRGESHTPTFHQVLFDRYHGPHILVNPKGYLIWKVCPSSIDFKKNERHGIVSGWWAPQSKEGPDGADQLVPPYPSEKLPPLLSDQAMCFSQNSRKAYTTYYSRKVRKVDNPNSSVSPWNYQRRVESIQKWRLPFQNLNLLSGWRTANYILPLMIVIVNFSSAKNSRVSKPQCRWVSVFISMANLVNFFSRKL